MSGSFRTAPDAVARCFKTVFDAVHGGLGASLDRRFAFVDDIFLRQRRADQAAGETQQCN